MVADDWLLRLSVKIYGMHNAGVFTFPAANAPFFFYNNAAAIAFLNGVAWAYFYTCRLPAAKTYNGDKIA